MLIKYAELQRILPTSQQQVYVLIGQDSYLMNAAATDIKQQWPKEADKRSITLNSHTDWHTLITEATSYHLFAEHTVLDAYYEKKTWDQQHKKILSDYLQHVNSRCLIVIRAPHIKAASLQWLHSNHQVVVVQIQTLNQRDSQQYIIHKMKARGMHHTPHIPALIYQYTQGNLAAAMQLIEKLSIIYEPGMTLDETIIQDHLSIQCEYQLYELTDACLQQNTEKAIHILRSAEQDKTEPTLLLWYLTQYIRQLIQLHFLQKTQSLQQACQQLKIWSSQISLYGKALQHLSTQSLFSLLTFCQNIELSIKSNQAHSVWHMLEQLVLAITKSTSSANIEFHGRKLTK